MAMGELRAVKKTLRWLSYTALALIVIALAYGVARFAPNHPQSTSSAEEHFKYGSLGGDQFTGIPVKLWQAMPLVCANTLHELAGGRLPKDYLDRVAQYYGDERDHKSRQQLAREGYKALGFIYEKTPSGEERALPVGMSRRHSLGLDRTYLNCAVCHTSTVVPEVGDAAQLVLGMPANLFNLYDFEQFMMRCMAEGSGSRIVQLDFIAEMESLYGRLNTVDKHIVYPLAIWALQDTMHFLANVAGFSQLQPHWGPGRNDTFTNNKVFLYGYDWRSRIPDWHSTGRVNPDDIGIVDFPSTWLQGKRQHRDDGQPMQLHWDGNNSKVEERNLNAAVATSSLPATIDYAALECIEQWMETLEPPRYPLPVNQPLAAQGEPIYRRYCADCHGASGRDFSGQYVGHVTHIDEIKTDRYRLDNYTPELALNMATTYADTVRTARDHTCPGGDTYQADSAERNYRYTHYRKTRGYANAPLDGVWARAPYLHNGSVPTLWHLLQPSALRPKQFYRGNNLLHPTEIGFEYRFATNSQNQTLFLFDSAIPGNGNWGHEGKAYGTELSDSEKYALLEYLKTF
ncbi:hypothetical protein [Halioxenophilus aromaticivorans]|uniref:Cytochrome c domain-containing protein n=1 Tax=Halioxenophilus aromaticivorans TaxID=1306992 RepID=A0AAV3U0F7_9ALTE